MQLQAVMQWRCRCQKYHAVLLILTVIARFSTCISHVIPKTAMTYVPPGFTGRLAFVRPRDVNARRAPSSLQNRRETND
ncbi:hypothetical protein EJB05_24085, partial [Eragrostis curvula]